MLYSVCAQIFPPCFAQSQGGLLLHFMALQRPSSSLLYFVSSPNHSSVLTGCLDFCVILRTFNDDACLPTPLCFVPGCDRVGLRYREWTEHVPSTPMAIALLSGELRIQC